MTTLNGDYSEKIRRIVGQCVTNIFKYYQKMMYGRENPPLPPAAKEKDSSMLDKIREEITEAEPTRRDVVKRRSKSQDVRKYRSEVSSLGKIAEPIAT